MIRLFASGIICFLLASAVQLGAQVSFYAHVDNEKINKGSFFKVEFQLSDARGTSFTPPDFSDFRVAAGPARSQQTSIVNGKMSRFESYSYTLQAIDEGDYELDPATVVVNGQTLKSNSIRISVLPPLSKDDLLKGGASVDGKDFILVAEINTDTAYAGQQILLDYRIFTRKNIDKVDWKQMPDLSDFQWNNLLLLNEQAQQVEIGGETYTTKLMRRVGIFPKRPGTYDLLPAQLVLMVRKPRSRGFFFDNYDTKVVHSNALKLTVLPLPEDPPESFSGLVGTYTMESSAGNRSLTTDDAITVRMRIKGNGDATRLSLPKLQTSDGLESYNPKIISSNKDQNQKKHDHFVLVEYLFTASEPGTYEVSPSFCFFDPDSMNYVTIKSQTYTFRITRGSGSAKSAIADTVNQYVKAQGRATRPAALFVSHPFGKVSWSILFLVSLILSFRVWRKERNLAYAPAKSLRQRCIEKLALLKESNEIEIAHRIEEIIGEFYRKKFDIEESQWSIEVISRVMESRGYKEEEINRLTDLLRKCEYAAYAGGTQAQQNDWIDEAIAILESEANINNL